MAHRLAQERMADWFGRELLPYGQGIIQGTILKRAWMSPDEGLYIDAERLAQAFFDMTYIDQCAVRAGAWAMAVRPDDYVDFVGGISAILARDSVEDQSDSPNPMRQALLYLDSNPPAVRERFLTSWTRFAEQRA